MSAQASSSLAPANRLSLAAIGATWDALEAVVHERGGFVEVGIFGPWVGQGGGKSILGSIDGIAHIVPGSVGLVDLGRQLKGASRSQHGYAELEWRWGHVSTIPTRSQRRNPNCALEAWWGLMGHRGAITRESLVSAAPKT